MSGHADQKEMLKFLSNQNPKQIKKTFLVHGEYATQVNYKERLLDAGFKHISIPAADDKIKLD